MRYRALAALLALVVLLPGCSVRLSRSEDGSSAPAREVSLEQSETEPPHSDLSTVIEDVAPSVVNVRVRGLGQDFLGNTTRQTAQGSGVVIDEAGVIVTNNHVVAGATEVTVVFNDGRKLAGTVLGTAPEKDLAVIEVRVGEVQPIVIGHSEELRLGDDVIALGFPLGLGGLTVTKGIVSGKDRNITVSGEGSFTERLEGVLQTDAAINPGNSGGALVDRAGHLVGINTAAASAGSAENIGFAIAIDAALPIIRQILEEPPEERAWLGVSIASVESPADAAELGLDADVRGAAVVGLFPGDPAEEAGVKEGEVITAIDDTEINSADDLTETLTEHDPGETVTLTLVGRDGTRELDVTLGERPVTLPD